MLRSSYFERSKPNEIGPAAEAWGLGGWIWGETGELAKIVLARRRLLLRRRGLRPSDGGGNFILDDQQSGYSVLGEALGPAALRRSRAHGRPAGAQLRLEPGRRLPLLQPLRRRLHRPARRARDGAAELRVGHRERQVRRRQRALLRRLRVEHAADQQPTVRGPRRGGAAARRLRRHGLRRRAVEDQQRHDAAGRVPRREGPAEHGLGRPRLRLPPGRRPVRALRHAVHLPELERQGLSSATSAPGTGPATSRRAGFPGAIPYAHDRRQRRWRRDCARRTAWGRRTWCSASARTRRPASRPRSSGPTSTSPPRRARPVVRHQLRPAPRPARQATAHSRWPTGTKWRPT